MNDRQKENVILLLLLLSQLVKAIIRTIIDRVVHPEAEKIVAEIELRKALQERQKIVTFPLFLPLVTFMKDQERWQGTLKELSRSLPGTLSLLETDLRYIQPVLQEWGIEVDISSNGREITITTK